MTILNNIEIPSFNDFSQVLDFVENHKNKLRLHFIQDNGKIQHNSLLSNVESENNEFNQIDIYHCMQCEAINESIYQEEHCSDCQGEHEDEDEDE